MKIIYLIPQSGYVTELRSDTLWGTLCWAIRHLWGQSELEAFLERCAAGKPDFVITSAFPFKQYGKERMPFFPNPFVLASEPGGTEREKVRDAYRLRKKLKNVAWLNLDDFRAALHGELSVTDLLERLRTEYYRKLNVEEGQEYVPLPRTVEQTAPERRDFSMTHNTIDRLRGGTFTIRQILDDGEVEEAGQLFHADDIWWADPYNDADDGSPNTGLYFLVDGDTAKLEAILRLLRHWGIGADRSTGKGAFDFLMEEFNMPEPSESDSNALLNLSLFRPTIHELRAFEQSGGCLQYLLEQREGYVGGYQSKIPKPARMYFQEGSVFKRPQAHKSRYMGGVYAHDFAELPHQVWDNGFGFMVNLNWKTQ